MTQRALNGHLFNTQLHVVIKTTKYSFYRIFHIWIINKSTFHNADGPSSSMTSAGNRGAPASAALLALILPKKACRSARPSKWKKVASARRLGCRSAAMTGLRKQTFFLYTRGLLPGSWGRTSVRPLYFGFIIQ
ncbi:hypothetical protein EYF80_057956 [Liparis tanakae]|uniref:Uncharacterized protein n=1 Tax=Liparis tanakae TaxID=230148 RepID=A0A4Z2ESK0_9TELE|nr:hypothetical protein EYF80_057956 [Liparis tanakae]